MMIQENFNFIERENTKKTLRNIELRLFAAFNQNAALLSYVARGGAKGHLLPQTETAMH